MSSCNFNHNSSLAITAWSSSIQVWQYTGNYSLAQTIAYNSSIYFGDFDSQSLRIAAGGYGFIDIWLYNVITGMYSWNQRLSTESFIGDVITEIVFSNDSNRMIASCVDHSLIVWKYDNITQSYLFSQKLIGHLGPVYSVSAKNLANTVVSGSEDSSIRIWTYDNVTGNYSLGQTIWTGS
jgi:WD40 repeat protein